MNRKTILPVGLSLALTAVATSATAQLETVGRRILVGSEPSVSAVDPAVAIDAEGRALVVWGIYLEDDVHRIYGRLLLPDGTPAGPPRPIDATASYSQDYPAVAAVGDGRFVVLWSRWDIYSDEALDTYEIYGRFVDGTTGLPRGSQFHVNTLRPFWQVHPAVAVSPTEDLFVVWVTGDPGDTGPFPQILGARLLSSDGTPASPQFRVNDLGSSPAEYEGPRPVGVATALTGVSLVVWASGVGVFGRRYGPGGAPLGPEIRVDELDERADWGPAVVADAEGNFVVTWISTEGYPSTSPTEILARAVDRRGVLGPTYSIGTTSVVFPGSTALAGDLFGTFVAAWTFDEAPSRSRVAVRQLTAGGEPIGEPILVTVPGQRVAPPDVAVGPGGEFLLVLAGLPDHSYVAQIFSQRLRRRATGSCVASATALCLQDERFRVEVDWKDFSGHAGVGRGVPLTADTGYFWFFSGDNVELVVKVLDGRTVNGHYWVFFGALSNVEYTVRVTDTETGEVWTRFNPAGVLASVADTAAF